MKINNKKQNNKEVNMHGTDLLPYEIYSTKIPNYFTSFPMHWHEEIEIVYVIEGSARYTVDFDDYIIRKGDILIVPPSSLHSFEENNNDIFTAATAIFSQSMVNNNIMDICSEKYIMPLFKNEISFPVHIRKSDEGCAELSSYLETAIHEHINKEEAYELKIRIAFLNFITYFYRNNRYTRMRQTSAVIRTASQIKAVTNYIEEHYSEKITLEMLAQFANISVYHLAHVFKGCTGQSPNEYLNHFRLTMAANRLATTDTAIINIAIDVGYNNISYFNRAFKNRYSMTPKEYRKSHIQEKNSI